MSEVDDVVVEPQTDESVDEAQTQTVDVDLSAVPEKHRSYVDIDKYQADEDYKRAIEHGWKPREAFEAEGLDDADWTGYRQFNRRYDDRQSIKAIKEGQDALMRTMEAQKQEAAARAVAQALAEREAQLQIAINDGDAATAAKLSQEIVETKSAAPKPAAPTEEPIAVEYARRRNGFINPASPDFDESINKEFEAICLAEAQRQYARKGSQLDNFEIKLIVDEALDMVQSKVKKPAPAKAAPAVSKPAGKAQPQGDLKNRLPKEWQDTYNRLLTAKGGGKDAAEAFAKEVLGGVK